MKKLKESKGVTLVALVATIVILLILISIGATSGISTINSAKFHSFSTELTIVQSKVNELNQNKKTDLGETLLENQKTILNKKEISDIIFKNKTEDEKTDIINGFRYFSKDYIVNTIGLNGITRDFLINIEKRFVVSVNGVEYNNVIYYMSQQMGNGVYNVEYNNKNNTTGSFDVTSIKENDKWRIQIININYNGYISNWQIEYKKDGQSYWNVTNEMSFLVEETGTYNVKVTYGDEVDLGSKQVNITNE